VWPCSAQWFPTQTRLLCGRIIPSTKLLQVMCDSHLGQYFPTKEDNHMGNFSVTHIFRHRRISFCTKCIKWTYKMDTVSYLFRTFLRFKDASYRSRCCKLSAGFVLRYGKRKLKFLNYVKLFPYRKSVHNKITWRSTLKYFWYVVYLMRVWAPPAPYTRGTGG
jgi:hypothetical protein